jgi:hypothetical protein
MTRAQMMTVLSVRMAQNPFHSLVRQVPRGLMVP